MAMSNISENRAPAIRKLFYSIGEVSALTGVPSHVLRYWESEFAELKPRKGRSGNRTYQNKDIEIIERIRALLYEQKFTIAGARAYLKENRDQASKMTDVVAEIRCELQNILSLLK